MWCQIVHKRKCEKSGMMINRKKRFRFLFAEDGPMIAPDPKKRKKRGGRGNEGEPCRLKEGAKLEA